MFVFALVCCKHITQKHKVTSGVLFSGKVANMESAAHKICSIVERHFDEEIEYKKTEVELITERIHRTKQVLDKLRAAIISKYYAVSDYSELSASENCVHPTVRAYFAGKTLPSARLSAASYDLPVKLGQGHLEDQKPTKLETVVKSMEKVKFVIGNVSRYIGDEDPEDIVTHIWVTYVRLHPSEKLQIQDILSKVRFFLHPSYFPHDVVDVTSPFQLKRKGWGEFSLRSQLHFVDPLNKPVDVIHGLKLDKFKTGLQTLGGETIFEVMLLVEKKIDSPTNPQVILKQSQLSQPNIEIKREPVDFGNPDQQIVASAVVKRGFASPSPTVIDLEAHGHDYCTPLIRTLPYVLVAEDSAVEVNSSSNVRLIKGESLLKTKWSTLKSVATPVTTFLEATANWDESLKKVDFSQDVYRLIDILAQDFFTLIGNRPVSDLFYQAFCIDDFFSCHIGKRKAIEWARASSLRRTLIKYGVTNVPRTRLVLLYLRKNGYTPLHESTDLQSTTMEGVQLDSYTYMDFSERLSSELAPPLSPVKRRKTQLDEDVEVDVESLQPQKEEDLSRRITVSSPRLQFIYDTLEQIVDERRLTEDRNELDALLRLMDAATMSFAERLLRRSLSAAFARNASNYEVDGILPVDVHHAVNAHDEFDFLGNSGLADP
ncbi:YEATS domain-containing protein 2-like isoform X1 [Varroa destructor]|uniref:YEATS domain-containing protein n=2 Tax=Varroa destructor TaxID=109461 RepID=A0A7M7K3F8_VARDE|nr:YEATS domain-containing protein 2-like isoform X1 [Varroa destructor]